MPKYIVYVPEVHVKHMGIEAGSEREATELVADGAGEQIDFVYQRTNWDDFCVELVKETFHELG